MIDRLTRREREVLELVCEGLTNAEIGKHLGISQRTVEIHRANLVMRIGARNTPHAVAIFVRSTTPQVTQ